MPKPRPRRTDFESNRRRLLDAAREIVAELGPEALSISEVARRAGLNRSTVHTHFATRAALVAAVKARNQRRTIEMLSAELPLEEWVDHLVDSVTSSPGMHRLMLHDLLEGNEPNHEGWHRYVDWIERVAKEQGVQGAPAPEFVAQFLIAIAMAWPLLANVHYDESELPAARRRLSGEIKRLLLHGFIDPARAPELVASLRTSDRDGRR